MPGKETYLESISWRRYPIVAKERYAAGVTIIICNYDSGLCNKG